MKRNPALQDLSREHYSALKLARDGKAAALAGDHDAIAVLAARIAGEFERELEPHFREEEASLLPYLAAVGETGLVGRTLAEHAELRTLAAALQQPEAGTLQRFAELLAAHVRFEERTLFEVAQERGFPPADSLTAAAAPTPATARLPAVPAPRP